MIAYITVKRLQCTQASLRVQVFQRLDKFTKQKLESCQLFCQTTLGNHREQDSREIWIPLQKWTMEPQQMKEKNMIQAPLICFLEVRKNLVMKTLLSTTNYQGLKF